MRTALRLENYSVAENLGETCRRMKPKLYQDLTAPWKEAASALTVEGATVPAERLAAIDHDTDAKLAVLRSEKPWGILELVKFLLLYLVITIPAAFLLGIIIGLVGVFAGAAKLSVQQFATSFCSFLDFVVPLWLIRRRTVLRPSVAAQVSAVADDAKRVLTDKIFYKHAAILFVPLILFAMFTYYLDPDFFRYNLNNGRTYNIVKEIPLWQTVFLVPIFEEIIFRKALFNSLRKYNRWLAYLVSSAIFAYIHPDMQAFIFLKSLAFTWFYERYNTLAAPIAIHSVNNWVAFAFSRVL